MYVISGMQCMLDIAAIILQILRFSNKFQINRTNSENILVRASELITVQADVNKLIMEEGGLENATAEMRNMSATVNKTLKLTCEWVSHI